MEVPQRLTEEHLRLGYMPRRRSPLPSRLELVETIRNWEVQSPYIALRTADVCGVFQEREFAKFWYQHEVVVVSPDGQKASYFNVKSNGRARRFELALGYDKHRRLQAEATSMWRHQSDNLPLSVHEGELLYAATTHVLAEEEQLETTQPPRAAGMFATLDTMRHAAEKFVMMKDRSTTLQVGMIGVKFLQPREEL